MGAGHLVNTIVVPFFKSDHQVYQLYWDMLELCLRSFKKNLKGEYDVLVTGLEVVDPLEAFPMVFEIERDLNQKGNVLTVGADMLCVRPVSIFGQFSQMTMFGLADVLSPIEPEVIVPYLCGTCYFPEGMPDKIWAEGERLFSDWNNHRTTWDYSQYVYNAMLHAQGWPITFDPRLSYNVPVRGDGANGDVPLEEASILHFHATRDPEQILVRMREYANHLGL